MTSKLLIFAAVAQASAGLNISATTADVALATLAADVSASQVITADTPDASFATFAATISVGLNITATTADIPVGVVDASVQRNINVAATTANLPFAANQASLGGETSEFLTDFPGYNHHPTSSTIIDPDSATPTVNIVVYNPDPTEVAWQQSVTGIGGVSGKTLNVNISLANKETSSSYGPNYEGPYVSATHDAVDWTNIPSYTEDGTNLSFQVVVPPGQTNVYIATLPPMNKGVALSWMNSLANEFPSYIHDDLPMRVRAGIGPYIQGLTPLARDQDNRTISGEPMYGFRIGNDAAGPQSPIAKRWIILLCTVHAMEFGGWHQMRGFVRRLLTGPDSAALLANNNIAVYPIMSGNANSLGYRRQEAVNSSTDAYDANRYWGDGNGTVPSIALWQDIMDENHGIFLHNVAAVFDWHDATTLTTNGTAYWNYQSGMSDQGAIEAIFTAIDPELVGVQSSVTGTTNEFFFSKGVKMPITCESVDEAYTVAGLEDLGAAYCDGLADIIEAGLLDDYDSRALGDFQTFSFETDMDGWIDGGGTLPWTRTNAGTPTTDTGPTSAYDGSFYVYTEATGAAAGSTFILQRDNVDLSKLAEIQTRFSRHVLGSTLRLEYWDGSAWQVIWSNSTSYNAPTWKNAGGDLSTVNLTSASVRFIATMPASNISFNDNGLDFIRFLAWAVSAGVDAEADTAAMSFAALDAQVLIGKNILATTANIPVSTLSTTVNAMVNVRAETADIAVSALNASTAQSAPIQATTASISAAAMQAGIIAPQVVLATTASLVCGTPQAAVINAVPTKIDGAASKSIGVAYGSFTIYHNGKNYFSL